VKVSSPIEKLYVHNGVALTLKNWSARTGIRYATLWARIHEYGLTFEEAISRPVRGRGNCFAGDGRRRACD
jgi:hypothetical protein